jgi:hypothetical protein
MLRLTQYCKGFEILPASMPATFCIYDRRTNRRPRRSSLWGFPDFLLHAYTLPRVSVNSRVRDLIDMVLLIGSDTLDKAKTVKAFYLTFNRRKTHNF